MAGEVIVQNRINDQLTRAIAELKSIREPLLSGEVDPEVLADFRDALNRVRNMAWAAQQSAASSFLEESPGTVAAFLAAERIRAAYQLCRAIQEDVRREDLEVPKGSLAEFYGAARSLVDDLKARV